MVDSNGDPEETLCRSIPECYERSTSA
jgi:hypothetical protein